VASVGVKVTVSVSVPAGGTVVGVAQTNPPGTDAVPPVNADEASVCPEVIVLAVGHNDTIGVAWFTTI
jgi:hypothetical protein